MARIRALPLAIYPNGTLAFGPFARGVGIVQLGFRVGLPTAADPTVWPSATTILTFDVQFSFDGGVTYTAPGSWVWSQGGGERLNKLGAQEPETGVAWSFSPDPLTHLKGTVTVGGGPIRTYLDIDGV